MIFGYNGRDGVVTDNNGLVYMRARYYSPEMKRFVNADIIPGKFTNSVTLNRYAYANSNPAMYIDPFGMFGILALIGTIVVIGLCLTLGGDSKQEGSSTGTSHEVDEQNNNHSSLNDSPEQVPQTSENKDSSHEIPKKENTNKYEPSGWIDDRWKNKDGSYSLYDNQRFGDSAFHEQLFRLTPSAPSPDPKSDDIGLGSVEFDLITGGWEGENVDLSLFDIGHIEAGAEIKDKNLKFGALASVWSPSFSFSIGKFSIDIGAEVGAGFKKVNNGFSLFGAYGFGGSLTFSWND